MMSFYNKLNSELMIIRTLSAIILFASLLSTGSFAQENGLYVPTEIQKAYENGTRSLDGKPGADYWHNTVDYKIDVKLIPEEKLIQGYEKITYHNNSPDKLDRIVLRLYQDAWKKGNSRDYSLNALDIHEGVKLSDVKIAGKDIHLMSGSVRRRGTNITFMLEQALEPGASLEMELSWKHKVPSLSRVRGGAYDETTFFVSQWYPQVAVYDDIFGWDMLNYTLMAEFYNNLGNFDVNISVPASHVVWATGTLENHNKVLPAGIDKKYMEAATSIKPIQVVDSADLAGGLQMLDTVWHYTAKEVPDFAFATSDHYIWESASQKVEDRDVRISAAYPARNSAKYSKLIEMQQTTMKFYSEEIPGVPYPWEAFTTFISIGGGGMEYPMMANNGGPGRLLTVHEMFHTYMPMYVRTNERRWAWMDEGWAQYTTAVTGNFAFDKDMSMSSLLREISSAQNIIGTVNDLPFMTPSYILAENYGYASYSGPGLVNGMLHQMLGEEMFRKCYGEFVRRWAQKSPTPFDFFNTFENVSGRDLDWLWKPWFYEFGDADLSINSYKKGKIKIANKGSKPVPMLLDIEYADGAVNSIEKDASVWNTVKKGYVTIKIPDAKNVKSIILNKGIPDSKIEDNFYPSLEELYSEIHIGNDLIGDYIIAQYGMKAEVLWKEDVLYLDVPLQNMSMMLLPKDALHYISLDNKVQLEFIQDKDGICTSVNINYSGMEFNARKVGVPIEQ